MSILLYVLLFVSFFINLGAIWYVRELLKEMRVYHDIYTQLNHMVRDYRNHLGAVYALDMFYGDTTLSELLRHTRNLSQDIDEYVKSFPFDDSPEEEEESFE